MKLGDLVKGECDGALGLVMEEEKYEGEIGVWVWYPEHDGSWRWYAFYERYNVEVVSHAGG